MLWCKFYTTKRISEDLTWSESDDVLLIHTIHLIYMSRVVISDGINRSVHLLWYSCWFDGQVLAVDLRLEQRSHKPSRHIWLLLRSRGGTCELASHSSHHLSYAAKTDLWNENHARMGISGHKNIRRTSVWNVLADCSGAGLVYLYLSWVVKCVRWHQTWQLSQRLVPTRTLAPPAWLCDRTSHKSPSIYISVIPSINLSLLHTQMTCCSVT